MKQKYGPQNVQLHCNTASPTIDILNWVYLT